MKKNILVTTMALAMAFTTVMGGANTLTVHAAPIFGDDGLYHGDGREPGGGGSASLDIGGDSGSSSSGSGSSNSGGGSYNAPSYDDGAYHGDGREAGGGGSASLDIGGDSGSSTASYSAPKAAGSTASAGKETFRAVAKAGDGTYKVIHKGIDIATFHLMDTESKKAVSCTKVTLKKRDDGKYAINFEVADATGLTVGAPLDRTYLYSTLGISYVTIGDDNIVIDIEAEAQAAATK